MTVVVKLGPQSVDRIEPGIQSPPSEELLETIFTLAVHPETFSSRLPLTG
jgi:hypothetical protein